MNDKVHPYTLAVIYLLDEIHNPSTSLKENIWSVTVGSIGGDIKELLVDELPDYVFERVALLKLTTEKEQGEIGRKLNDLMFTIYLTRDEYKELNSLSGA